jgi:hypothetical protein
MILEKLDRRHKGIDKFKYRVSFTANEKGYEDFNKIRSDCWAIWGPSCELEFTYRDASFKTPVWAFNVDSYNSSRSYCYIYLASDDEASFIKLKWM